MDTSQSVTTAAAAADVNKSSRESDPNNGLRRRRGSLYGIKQKELSCRPLITAN